MTFIETIRELIAEGETEKSLDELRNYVRDQNDEALDKIILLKNRMHHLKSARLVGTMDDQEVAIEQARINESILKLLHDITPAYVEAEIQKSHKTPPPPRPEKQRQEPPKKKRGWLVALVVIAVISVVLFLVNEPSDEGIRVEVQTPLVQHNVYLNNNYNLQIWLPGRIKGAAGSSGQLVARFFLNGQNMPAAPQESSAFKDTNGNVAVGTQVFPILSDDYELSQHAMYIPYSAFNLPPTGMQTKYPISMYVEVYVGGISQAISSYQSFDVYW